MAKKRFRLKPTKISEAQVSRQVKQWLTARGITTIWRSNNTGLWDARTGRWRPSGAPKGVPDFIGWIHDDITQRAMFCGLEIKSPTGKLSDEQKAFLDRINQDGGIGIVVRSVADLELELGPYLRR